MELANCGFVHAFKLPAPISPLNASISQQNVSCVLSRGPS